MDDFRYIDNHEPISRDDIAEMTRQSLLDNIGVAATETMTEEEFDSQVDDAVTARLEHGLIEEMPEEK